MKKLISAPETVVADALRGLALAHPGVRVDHEHRVVYRAEPKDFGTVALVSGGGSGHEPLHTGYVGFGMLDAAVAGDVFTSPTPDQIHAATIAVERGAGVLYIVKNYTGDVLNFELAAELAQAARIDVRTVVVADDVAVADSTFTAGRRGTGTTVLLEKIVGAAAEQGHDLETLHDLATRIAASGRSMGVALSAATVPAAGVPTFQLADDEIEWGVGIHGEPGRARQTMAPAPEIAERLVGPLVADGLPAGDAIVMLSGLGATPLIELYAMLAEMIPLLEAVGVRAVRTLVGNTITALDMAGCLITVLPVDAELLSYWDAPVETPALRWGR